MTSNTTTSNEEMTFEVYHTTNKFVMVWLPMALVVLYQNEYYSPIPIAKTPQANEEKTYFDYT